MKAKALTDEAVSLARKILDTRLALTRLRQAHPHPRLTVPSAEAQLDAQVAEMQSLEDQLQSLNDDIDSVKERVKSGARDVERRRVHRAELEKQVKATRSDGEDKRVLALYDWCVFVYHKLSVFPHVLLLSLQVHRFTRPPQNSSFARVLPLTSGE